ncbi:MAG: hypothetical protein MUE83_11215 [Tabrizicola sp.]|nr:hypothetical protein [Tabrizicola sp.]
MTRAAELLVAGRPIAAQWWIRRAFRHARGHADEAILREAYATAAEANPVTLNVWANVAPTDNINNGADSEFFSLGDILLVFDPASQALSGTEYAASVAFSYRLARSDRASTSLGVNLYGRTYTLSSAAQAAAPDVSGSDYALVLGEVELRQQLLLGQDLGLTTLSLHLGQVEYGKEPLYRYSRVTAAQDFRFGQGAMSIGFGLEDQVSQSPDRADALIHDGRISYAYEGSKGAQWRWTLTGRKTNSSQSFDSFDEVQGGVSVSPAWRLFGTAPTFSLDLGGKHYDEFVLSFDGRRDRFVRLGASLVFEQVAVMGFSPVLTVSGTRTRSNVERYDTAEVRASLGFQSRF